MQSTEATFLSIHLVCRIISCVGLVFVVLGMSVLAIVLTDTSTPSSRGRVPAHGVELG